MTSWNYNPSAANRGMDLEKEIEDALLYYQHHKKALIQKVPTPIKPVKVDYKRKSVQGFFEKKSTVDYIGNYRGLAIAFDAKETGLKNMPLSNIEQHQYDYLKENAEMGGISFLIVAFTALGQNFYLPFSQLQEYWILAKHGGRKSIPYSDFHSEIVPGGLTRLDFLKNVDKHLKGEVISDRQRATGS